MRSDTMVCTCGSRAITPGAGGRSRSCRRTACATSACCGVLTRRTQSRGRLYIVLSVCCAPVAADSTCDRMACGDGRGGTTGRGGIGGGTASRRPADGGAAVWGGEGEGEGDGVVVRMA